MYGSLASGVTATASINQQLYRFDQNCIYAKWDLKLINPNSSAVTAKIWVSKTTTPTNSDLFEFAALLPANGGVFQASSELASKGDYVFINTSLAGVVYRLTGEEKTSVK